MRLVTCSPRVMNWSMRAAQAPFTTTTANRTGESPPTGRSRTSMLAKAPVACVLAVVVISACAPAQPGPAATTIVPSKPTTTGAVASPSASVAIAVAKPVVSPVVSPGPSPAASPGVAASPSPVALATPRPAPQPVAAGIFGFGRPASADEVKTIDIDVRPDGAGLPAGSGTGAQGRQIFAQKCAVCHGANGEGTAAGPRLIDATPFKT